MKSKKDRWDDRLGKDCFEFDYSVIERGTDNILFESSDLNECMLFVCEEIYKAVDEDGIELNDVNFEYWEIEDNQGWIYRKQ